MILLPKGQAMLGLKRLEWNEKNLSTCSIAVELSPNEPFSVPDPIDIIRKCQFNLLGKFAHMDPTCLPCKFLTTWVSHPRHSGGQHYTLQNSYIETLQHILPNTPDNGAIDSWLPLVQNREQWKTLGTEWMKHRQALMIYQYSPHPLSGDGILDHQVLWYLQDIHRR
jgi:hypothetical protein